MIRIADPVWVDSAPLPIVSLHEIDPALDRITLDSAGVAWICTVHPCVVGVVVGDELTVEESRVGGLGGGEGDLGGRGLLV